MHKKPLSPHLQIYKPQLTSTLSIFHRISGVFLSSGIFLLLWWLFALSQGGDSYRAFMLYMASTTGSILKLFLAFAVMFHLLNGIRHLVWDFGYALSMKAVYFTGWGVVLITFMISLFLWILIL